MCYFCQDLVNPPSLLQEAPAGSRDGLFSLHPDENPHAAETLLLFCIDVSGSMSMTCQVRWRSVYRLIQHSHIFTFFKVTEKEGVAHRSRLQVCFSCFPHLQFNFMLIPNFILVFDEHSHNKLRQLDAE